MTPTTIERRTTFNLQTDAKGPSDSCYEAHFKGVVRNIFWGEVEMCVRFYDFLMCKELQHAVIGRSHLLRIEAADDAH
jgi:hypothetical protein